MSESKEMLLLEALCHKLGFDFEFEEGRSIPSGQILVPSKYVLTDSVRIGTHTPIENNVFGVMVEYILAHQGDIESGINDYGSLKPVLEYFSRNC